MIPLFDASHIDMWDIVENKNHIPLPGDGIDLPKFLWNEEQKLRYLLNSKARNFISALIESKYEKCIVAMRVLRFQTTINNLRSLGKVYDNYDNITKILRSLPRWWRPQVTALRASKDLIMFPIEVIGTLKFYEIELKKEKKEEKGSPSL
ncbi:hypothetical protein CR513_35702, partial [Mucuna pruriens]